MLNKVERLYNVTYTECLKGTSIQSNLAEFKPFLRKTSAKLVKYLALSTLNIFNLTLADLVIEIGDINN